MTETVAVVVTGITCWALGLSVGYFGLRTPIKMIKLGSADPAACCPTCHGTGRRNPAPMAPLARVNCAHCGARPGGRHAGHDCPGIAAEKA